MNEIRLKQSIPKGTIIKDLYDHGVYFYKIGNSWIPADFNKFRLHDWVTPTKKSKKKI